MTGQLTKSIPHIKRVLGLLGPKYAPDRVRWEDGVGFVFDLSKIMGAGIGPGRPACGYVSQAGALGQYSQVQINNPTSSGQMMFVERVIMSTNPATRFRFDRQIQDIGLAGGARMFIDEASNLHPSAELRSGTVAAPSITARGVFNCPAVNTDREILLGILLAPGDGVIIEDENQNATIHATFFWREETA